MKVRKVRKLMALILAVSTVLLTACGTKPSESNSQTAPPAAAEEEVTPAAAPAEAASAEKVSLGTVTVGIHQGGSANCAAFLVEQLELDKKNNFEIELVVTTGPNVSASISADEMDVGFLGNGMAWHYFEKDSKMSLLTIDNLTGDDKMIFRNDAGFLGDGKDTAEDLYAKLPGKTLALDLTTTPGVFWKALVDQMNENQTDVVWYEDVEGAYPKKGSADKNINILNTANANITAAMEDKSIDGTICFGSVRKGLQESGNYMMVASPESHLKDTVIPSTYCTNTKWANENPELLQAFTDALMEAFDYRANPDNWDNCINLAMAFDQLEYKDYDLNVGYWPITTELYEWFSKEDGNGYVYLNNIRNSHIGSNGLTEENMKSVDDAFLKEFLLNACS